MTAVESSYRRRKQMKASAWSRSVAAQLHESTRVGNKVLNGKGETVYEEKWNAGGVHGAFTATAKLRSNIFPVETSVEFVLP